MTAALMTVREVAAAIHETEESTRRRLRRGDIAGRKTRPGPGGQHRVHPNDVDRFLRGLPPSSERADPAGSLQ